MQEQLKEYSSLPPNLQSGTVEMAPGRTANFYCVCSTCRKVKRWTEFHKDASKDLYPISYPYTLYHIQIRPSCKLCRKAPPAVPGFHESVVTTKHDEAIFISLVHRYVAHSKTLPLLGCRRVSRLNRPSVSNDPEVRTRPSGTRI